MCSFYTFYMHILQYLCFPVYKVQIYHSPCDRDLPYLAWENGIIAQEKEIEISYTENEKSLQRFGFY